MIRESMLQSSASYITARATPAAVDKAARASNGKIRGLLKKGKEFHVKEDWANALKYYNKAWRLKPDDLNVLCLVAYGLLQMNAREQVLGVVEVAIAEHGVNETLCQILGVLATNMHEYAIAEKLWHQAIRLNPSNPSNYANLLGTLFEQNKFDEVVSIAQEIIPIFPENADLWCILATSVSYTNAIASSEQFFEEALRFDPYHFRSLNNYALKLDMSDKGLELLERARQIEPENSEINIGIAFHLLFRGKLKEGWSHYEYRLNPDRGEGQNVRYHVPVPDWTGEIDKEKTVIVLSEQGVGDEILNLRLLPKLMERVGQVVVGCDVRLINLIEHSFPGVRAVAHADVKRFGYRDRAYPGLVKLLRELGRHTNVAKIAGASLWKHFCPDVETIPIFENGYVKARPEVTDRFRTRLREKTGGRPCIGISWKSSKESVKRQGVVDFSYQEICAVLIDLDIYVVSLQYTKDEEAETYLKEKLGPRFIQFSDLDMKKDIEENFAIIENLDLVVGPLIAPQTYGIASGAETWAIAQGKPWWIFGEDLKSDGCFYIPNLNWMGHITAYLTEEEAKNWQYLEGPWGYARPLFKKGLLSLAAASDGLSERREK